MARHSFEVKLAAARRHLQVLEEELRRIEAEDMVGIVREDDADGLGYIERITYVETIPDSVSAGFGDCLQNLRSALDHIVWEIAPPQVIPGPRIYRAFVPAGSPLPAERPPQMTPEKLTAKPEFPIFVWPKDFTDSTRRTLKLLPADAIAALERLQPYHGWHGFGGTPRDWLWADHHPLWVLHELVNIDKHRAIHAAVVRGGSEYVGPDIPNWGHSSSGGSGRLEPGTVVLKVRYTSLEMARMAKVGYKVIPGVGLAEPRIGLDAPLPEMLEILLFHIESEVLPALAPFLP